MSTESIPSIASFYENKTVLITGASGFLGKVILETLLRTCPGVKTIYLVVRNSKDKTAEKRVEESLRTELFDEAREIDPQFERKVVALAGDLRKPKLGLSEENYNKVLNEVQIILHSAASVSFNEDLKDSLETNVCAVEEVCRMSHLLKDLHAFIHVSTAYSQCNQDVIHEKIYRSTIDTKSVLETIERMQQESPEEARKSSKALAKALMNDRPNTYTLTKSIAEDAVYRHATGQTNDDAEWKCLPFAVLRPSIVGCIAGKSVLKNPETTKRGPREGWVDNLNGPGGLYMAASHSLLRVMPGNLKASTDMVPVDFVANMIVVAAVRVAQTYYQIKDKTDKQSSPFPLVFNCTSGATNPMKLKDHNVYAMNEICANPVEKSLILKPAFFIAPNRFEYEYIWKPLCHHIPAFFIDLSRVLSGKKPIMSKVYKKLHAAVDAYAYFSSNEWKWDVDNAKSLYENLSEEDKKIFNFDFATVDWEPYITLFVQGSQEFAIATRPAKPTTTKQSSPIQTMFFIVAILVLLFAALFTLFGDVLVDSSSFKVTNGTLSSPTFFRNLFTADSE